MTRVFVDSDVILDLVLKREPHFSAAARLFLLIQGGELQGYTSSLAFANLFYILRKQGSREQAVTSLRKLRLLISVLGVDERVVDLALASAFNDFEDAIQHFAALESGLDAIVTRNQRDYSASRLPVLSPEECVELCSRAPG